MLNKEIYIIAEAGVNHNGNLQKAFELIDIAAAAKANAVKFQTFKAEKLVSHRAARAQYQILNMEGEETQFEMLKKLELSESDFSAISDRCRAAGIEFLSTAFDTDSLHLLVNNFGIKRIKI